MARGGLAECYRLGEWVESAALRCGRPVKTKHSGTDSGLAKCCRCLQSPFYRELCSDADGLCNHGLIIGCTSNNLDGFVVDDNGHDA